MAPPSVAESPFFPQRAGQCVVMRVPMRQAGVFVVVWVCSLDRTDVCVDCTNSFLSFCIIVLFSYNTLVTLIIAICVYVFLL